MIRVSIIGSTGYTGGELLRLLIRHPDIELTHLTSESFVGKPIHEIHKFLKGRCAILCEKANLPAIAKDSDVVFLGLPHGAAAKSAAILLDKGTRVIDLSADFRIQDMKTFEKWYGEHPVAALVKEAVYGLPERYREEIKSAKLVANPGCHASTAVLAGLPLFSNGLLGEGPLIIDSKTGISGAGRKTEVAYLYAEANESMSAYGLKGHRHQPEILQEWQRAAGPKSRKVSGDDLIFVPYLAPITRGILSTLYAPLAKKMTVDELRDLYLAAYLREPFVSVIGAQESPEVKSIAFSNMCQIGVSVSSSGKQAIIIAALDNLTKGASGVAVQNMNIMFGLDETKGLL